MLAKKIRNPYLERRGDIRSCCCGVDVGSLPEERTRRWSGLWPEMVMAPKFCKDETRRRLLQLREKKHLSSTSTLAGHRWSEDIQMDEGGRQKGQIKDKLKEEEQMWEKLGAARRVDLEKKEKPSPSTVLLFSLQQRRDVPDRSLQLVQSSCYAVSSIPSLYFRLL
ncbi:hypothetical protein ACLOJK_029722 [Asimina triloba]